MVPKCFKIFKSKKEQKELSLSMGANLQAIRSTEGGVKKHPARGDASKKDKSGTRRGFDAKIKPVGTINRRRAGDHKRER